MGYEFLFGCEFRPFRFEPALLSHALIILLGLEILGLKSIIGLVFDFRSGFAHGTECLIPTFWVLIGLFCF